MQAPREAQALRAASAAMRVWAGSRAKADAPAVTAACRGRVGHRAAEAAAPRALVGHRAVPERRRLVARPPPAGRSEAARRAERRRAANRRATAAAGARS